MRRLAEAACTDAEPLFIDEHVHHLLAALEDTHFARHLLRSVGETERERFDELPWYYGDPSVFGGDALEMYELQLLTVLRTLFGYGRYEGRLIYALLDGDCVDEEELLRGIEPFDDAEAERHGGVGARDPDNPSSARAGYVGGEAPPTAGLPVASYLGGLRTLSEGYHEAVLIAEISGEAEDISGLVSLLRPPEATQAAGEAENRHERPAQILPAHDAAVGDTPSEEGGEVPDDDVPVKHAPPLYRWNRGFLTDRPELHGAGRDHLLTVFGADMAELQQMVQHGLFDALRDAWSRSGERSACREGKPAMEEGAGYQ